MILRATLGMLALAAGAGAAPEASATKPNPPPRYRWENQSGESLALIGPCGVVWKLNFSPTATKPYFHPLQTSDGTLLTWVAPPDHLWHYGLWHAWKFIDGVNYWEEDAKTGRSDGTTRIVGAEVRRADDAGAEVRLRLEYFPAKEPGAVLLDEMIDVAIDLPARDGSYRIAWRQETSARKKVMLDRTPLPSEPNGKSWGGYAGLGLRGSRFLREVSIIDSEGAHDMAVHGHAARWASLSGTTDGRAASVTFFDHPSNPRHPAPWFVVETPQAPFWYLATGFLYNHSFELAPGAPLVRRYLVRVDRQRVDATALEEEFRRFARSK